MTEKQTTLDYNLDGQEVVLTLVRATARIGMLRYQLMVKANDENETEPDEALKLLRLVNYPNCIAATAAVSGLPWPLPFLEYAELPEDFVNRWLEAIYALNPQWLPPPDEEEAVAEPESKKRKKTPR